MQTRLCKLIGLAAVAGWTATAVHANPPSFQERLLQPDWNQSNPIGEKRFDAAREMGTKEFRGDQAFATRAAPTKSMETGPFRGLKIPWFQSKSVATETFDTRTSSESERKARVYPDRKDEARGFSDAELRARGVRRALPVREARVEGASQNLINAFRQNLEREMSPGEIRELLNKGPRE